MIERTSIRWDSMNISNYEYGYIKGKLEALSSWLFHENKDMYSEIDSVLDILEHIEKRTDEEGTILSKEYNTIKVNTRYQGA